VAELNDYATQMVNRLQRLPELRDVATDQQTQGLAQMLVFDRRTASRLGLTPSAIDQTLYDAFGQRQVSTMFTQLNQYHVVLEVKPEFQQDPLDLSKLFIRTGVSGNAGGIVSGGTSSTNLSTGPTNAAANSTAAILTGAAGAKS